MNASRECTLEKTRARALHCLLHPSSLLAIGLLLWNDHYGKFAYSSWWTGKLSDFAGLYFFPFLVLFILGSFLPRVSTANRHMVGFVFAGTALVFILIKCFAEPNRLAVEALQFILNTPVAVARDPGDLMALVMLIPAALLWKRKAVIAPVRARLLFPIVPTAAILGCIATSIAARPHVVGVRVLAGETYLISILARGRGGDFANSPDGLKASRCKGKSREYCRILRSEDRGLTWIAIKKPNRELWKKLLSPAAERNLARDYRGGPKGRLEYSAKDSDWKTAWSIPSGRHAYMKRKGGGLFISRDIDPGPYEIARTPYGIIAAMGDQGILLKNESGDWKRIAAGGARPVPFRDWNPLNTFFVLLFESLVLLAAFPLVFALVSIPVLFPFRARIPGPRLLGLPRSWIIAALICLGLTLITSVLDLMPLSILLLPGLVLLYFFLGWLQVRRIEPTMGGLHLRAWATALFTPGLVWLFLYAWTTGLIPWYRAALFTGLILGLLYFLYQFRILLRGLKAIQVKPAPAPDSPPAP